jgi:hypothetical protein
MFKSSPERTRNHHVFQKGGRMIKEYSAGFTLSTPSELMALTLKVYVPGGRNG